MWDVAVQHGVGRAICFRWLRRMMQGHAINASSKRIYKTWSSISSDHMEIALMHLQQSPPSHAAFQRELCQLIEVETGVHYDQFQMHRALNKEDITRRILHYEVFEQANHFGCFLGLFLQRIVTSQQCVFVDESHCKAIEFRRRCGYGYRGLPAFVRVPCAAGNRQVRSVRWLSME